MRTRTVSIRFTDTEWELLSERAEREGRTVSNLIRLQLFTGIPAEPAVPTPRPAIRSPVGQRARDQLLNKMRTR